MTDKEPCQYLPWDSDFFGFRIARVVENRLSKDLISEINSWCKENQIDCLYLLALSDHAETVLLAENNGFRFVDIRVTLELDMKNRHLEDRPANLTLRPFKTSDLVNLQRIARYNFSMTRFYFDRCFPEELCNALYETWVTKSCQGFADMVLIAEISNQIAGFITGNFNKDLAEGSVGLIGIDETHRKRGIAQGLLRSLIDWFDEQGSLRIEVVTQGRNIGAQRLYQRCNFLTKNVRLWYHRWFRECS